MRARYMVKQKHHIRGYFWVAGRLFPRNIVYSFFFMGILSVEIVISVARYLIGEPLQYDFILLVFVTAVAMFLFLIEGILSVKQ
jgi:hypothetical protein